MYPVLFRITEQITIRSYGIMLAIAFFVGIFIARRFARKDGVKPSLITDLSFWVILATIVGGRLLYVLMNLKEYLRHPIDIVRIWQGGLIFYGGFFLSILVAIWYFKRNKINAWKGLDILSPAAAIGYSIARIGCFLNGCCYGKPTKFFLGIKFPLSSSAGIFNVGMKIHPTQLYAMLVNLVIFLILWFCYPRKKFNGQIFWSYIFMYSIYRFLIEFIRGDKSPLAFGLTAIQFITIFLFISSILGYLELRRRASA
jgi:phosphatidylglycerol:prolipoprotein diacylglycerol transferase